ncbi:ABC transporter permease [Nocardioides pantholopis]|uniref:ABC transporter permease n=1 Tax=Nocardioides pantholopis TaxID=2483798 RepID=UPI0019D1575A|nr:FtsX-like permease family protein [Nocardioides pantholopis]
MRPSFLAIRELSFARGRFALMGVVVALIAVLMVLLSGLSVGLVNDGVSGLQRLPVTSLAFQEDVEKSSAYSRSVVSTEAADAWAQRPDVAEAAPFGNTLANGRTTEGVEIDLALFGVELGSFVDPGVAEGERLRADNEVVISASAADEGVELGHTVVLEPSGMELKVVGILADQHTYGHVDIGYLSLRSWQEAKAGVRPGDAVADRVYEEATAVAVRAADGAEVDLAAGDEAAGTTSLTLEDSFDASPGYSAETSTLQLIQGFLYVISALVVGAFFTVLTVQRKGEIAVLRALGASTGYLLRESLLQSIVLLAVSAGIGIAAGVGLGLAIGATEMPFALEAGPIVAATLLLLVLGVAGAAVAVLRITRVDPLTALGGSR